MRLSGVFLQNAQKLFLLQIMKLCVCCLSKTKQKDEKHSFCQFYEIVCILLVKPYTLEQPKQNYTVVERSTFSSW